MPAADLILRRPSLGVPDTTVGLLAGRGAKGWVHDTTASDGRTAWADRQPAAVRRPTKLGRRSSADRRRSERCFGSVPSITIGSLQLSVAMGKAQRWMVPSKPPVAKVWPSGANASE